MTQVALNSAPGSTDNLPQTTSPCIIAFDFIFNISDTCILPSNFPSISAFLQIISPITLPAGPITIFPFDWKFPVNSPSNLKSACDTIVPLIIVPSTILFVLPSKSV